MDGGRSETIGATELPVTLDSLREGIQILGTDWRYLYVNEAVARHGRKTVEQLLGRTMLECYPGIEKTELFSVLDGCMRERRSEQLENEFAHENGEREWFELRIRPCPEGLIVLSLDITERKRLDDKLRQVHKLRALGQMAAGVAHDLKNILNPLGLQVELLKRRARTDPESLEILGQMNEVLERGRQTIDLLRDFGRQEPTPALEPIDVRRIAREAAQICRPRVMQHQASIALREALSETSPVRVSAPELLSALVNLIVNSLDALPSGGTITVRSGVSPQGIFVEVEDDGLGMPPPVQARAFEPFFTTKGQAGTGLGLAMVYAFVSRHGGTVRLRTSPGEGTTVTLVFPPAA